jgi:hypothetical protein
MNLRNMEKEQKKLYKVKAINQVTGEEYEKYFLSRDMGHLEFEVADILSVEPIYYEDVDEE